MPPKLRIAYFAHSVRSDWNNGNAHFLRGLLRALVARGHEVTVYEPVSSWSAVNLEQEPRGAASLQNFVQTYADLDVQTYQPIVGDADWQARWAVHLKGVDVVVLHEWNPVSLAQALLLLKHMLGYTLLFHDTHHRASSSPDQIDQFGLRDFDGILAFGDSLRKVYVDRFGFEHVWTLHEAADTSAFHPHPEIERKDEIIWVGNWGDGERSHEIEGYLLKPAAELHANARTTIYGVRYPAEGLAALRAAGVAYGGYLPNLQAPAQYASARATVHIPRQQYSQVIEGIPTIRVFEALACGIPLVSAPWQDSEGLFRPGDFLWARNTSEMTAALRALILDPAAAQEQARRGLETVLARHTCRHRANELTAICEELIG